MFDTAPRPKFNKELTEALKRAAIGLGDPIEPDFSMSIGGSFAKLSSLFKSLQTAKPKTAKTGPVTLDSYLADKAGAVGGDLAFGSLQLAKAPTLNMGGDLQGRYNPAAVQYKPTPPVPTPVATRLYPVPLTTNSYAAGDFYSPAQVTIGQDANGNRYYTHTFTTTTTVNFNSFTGSYYAQPLNNAATYWQPVGHFTARMGARGTLNVIDDPMQPDPAQVAGDGKLCNHHGYDDIDCFYCDTDPLKDV